MLTKNGPYAQQMKRISWRKTRTQLSLLIKTNHITYTHQTTIKQITFHYFSAPPCIMQFSICQIYKHQNAIVSHDRTQWLWKYSNIMLDDGDQHSSVAKQQPTAYKGTDTTHRQRLFHNTHMQNLVTDNHEGSEDNETWSHRYRDNHMMDVGK